MKRLGILFILLAPVSVFALTLSHSDYDFSVIDHLLHAQTKTGWVSASSVLSRNYYSTLLTGFELTDDSEKESQVLEVKRLRRESIEAGPLHLRMETQIGTSYVKSYPIQLIGIAATSNPSLAQNGGMFNGGGFMQSIGARIEGTLTPYFGFSARPNFLYSSRDEFGGDASEFFLGEGFGSIRIRDLAVEGGLGNIEWGNGRATHLLFSGDTRPLWMGRIRSDQPVVPPGFLKFLGPTQFEGFLAFLGDHYNFPNARLFGFFFDSSPTPNLEFGIGGTVVFGGTGASTNNPAVIITDYFGKGGNSSANRNFLLTGRYRIPNLGIEPYFEAMMEDCCSKALVNPRDFATLAGLLIPRVDPAGKLDLAFEWVRTSQVAYSHSSFSDGLTFKGRSLGTPLGPGALGFYFIGRYFRSPRFIFKTSLGYEIRERLSKAPDRSPIQTIYPAYQVPDQRVRLEIQPDWLLADGRLVVSPTAALERATGKGYVQNQEGYNIFLGMDLRYLF
ncbi:MAG: capsule assembly Wzi family protein [Pseudomonadota bacterium]